MKVKPVKQEPKTGEVEGKRLHVRNCSHGSVKVKKPWRS